MKTSDEFVGRVALATGRSLAGFVIEIRFNDFQAATVSDGSGRFQLPKPKKDQCVPLGFRGELIVRTPDNQVVHRQWCAMDGRYLGITLPRKSLPRTLGHGTGLPRTPRVTPIAPLDVGQQGEIVLSNVPRDGTPAPGRVAAVGDRVAIACGSTLWVWTMDTAKHRTQVPARVALKGDVLDLAGDPTRGEIVLLVNRPGKSEGRDVFAVDAEGNIARRVSIDGTWCRFAILPGKPVVAFAAPRQEGLAWAILIEGDMQICALPWIPQDIACVGERVVVASSAELRTFDIHGKLLGKTAWSARKPVLVEAGADAVLAFDAARGRATRFLIGEQGNPTAVDTIYLGRHATIGWWNERAWLIRLMRDLLRWWRLPSLVPVPPLTPREEFVFFGRT